MLIKDWILDPDDPEEAKKRFVKILEAYKTLTDDPLANLGLDELLEKLAKELFGNVHSLLLMIIKRL